MKAAMAALLCVLALAFGASPAVAEFGDGFGFQDVNQPGAPTVPAFSPATEAVWAGTCDLTSVETTEGGVGPHNGGAEPPAVRGHCLEVTRAFNGTPGTAWPVGGEPSWRLRPVTAAGSHPDATASFFFQRPPSSPAPDGTVKNIIVKLPPGVVGSPEALSKCPASAVQATPPACHPSSQAGLASISFTRLDLDEINDVQSRPIYATEARDTVTAEFSVAFVSNFFNVPVTARGRTNGDYGVDTLALLIPNFVELGGQTATFWGVPWAAEHDKWRARRANDFNTSGDGDLNTALDVGERVPYEPSWGPIKPFFTNPTECTGKPLPLVVEIDSWQNPVSLGGSYVSATVDTDVLEGCEELEFEPAITLRPTVSVADSPSGVDVKLTIPQNDDPPAEALGNPNLPFDPDDASGAPAYWKTPAGRASAHLKDTTVRLPVGTSFNPAAANGLRGCTTAEVGVTALTPKVTFDNEPHRCPDTSKIGTLKVVSPLLPDPLLGDVYAAPQHDNPFPGALTAIYMVAQDEERGLSVKLAGKVDLDPRTGQIATTFVDNPQLPFESFELNFKNGPRAPLNTPAVCGQFKNSATFVPWSFPHTGPPALIEDPFPIAAMPSGFGCVTEPEDRVFAPGFSAGSVSPQAGAHTDFSLRVTRRDGEQELSAIALQMPPGLTAKLAGVPYCPDASLAEIEATRSGRDEAAASLCPAASELGTTTALAGAGPLPLPTSGRLFLAGPYDPDGAGPQGTAPLSIAAVVPAIAGGVPGQPAFDLGNVVVRSAAYLDPRTAQVRIASTPLPYIVGGVPLRIRDISVDITKPGFMLNPTNCSELRADATLGGAADPLDAGDDISVGAGNRFQVGNCEALGFKPTLKLRLFGGTKRGKYQRLQATLTARPGDANIASASVRMPGSAFLAQEHLNNICTRVQFAREACPAGSVYGRATAWSPLLDYPVTGPVRLRSSDNPLPDLVADLRGPDRQPVRIELVGRTDSVKRALRNTFDVAPDAPVSKFQLELFGGRKGLIVNSQDLCLKKRHLATVRLTAQNGRQRNFRPKVANGCKKVTKKKRRAGKAQKRK